MARFCLQTHHWQVGQEFVDQVLKIEESHPEALSIKAALQKMAIQQPHIPCPASTNGAGSSTWSSFKQRLQMNFPRLVDVARKLRK